MNNIKKIFSVIPFLLAVLVLYGAFTGKIRNYLDSTKKSLENVKSEKENGEEKTYPPGKITSLKDAFEWEDFGIPKVDEYDPDNKIAGDVYGSAKAEWEHIEECREYERKYDAEHPLEERYRGLGKYNPDRLVKVGEEFERKTESLTCKIEGIEIKDDIKDIDKKYVNPDGREYVLPYIDESGKMNPGVLYEDVGNDGSYRRQEFDNSNIKFASVHLSVSGYSEWIQEVYILYPGMIFLNDEGDLLSDNLNCVRGSKNEDIVLGLGCAFYDDLGFYDFDTCLRYVYTSYPIRKGETVEFTVMYTVPEVYIDKAYLLYYDAGYPVENPYNYQDLTLIKLIQ